MRNFEFPPFDDNLEKEVKRYEELYDIHHVYKIIEDGKLIASVKCKCRLDSIELMRNDRSDNYDLSNPFLSRSTGNPVEDWEFESDGRTVRVERHSFVSPKE